MTKLPAPKSSDRANRADPPHSAAAGAAAEDLAAAFLISRGLTLLERNLHCKGGEIDLVCEDGAVLVMVEVRQRATLDFGGALASVTAAKRHKLLYAARFALQRRPAWRNRRVRFDVIGVEGSLHGSCRIAWIKDAFRAT